jgi:adenylate cyclase
LRDVVQGRTTDDEQALIKDAVVIIGVTAKLFGDHHLTPYANRLFSGWTAREPVLMSGAELHAGIVATLLDGAYFWRLPLGWELVLLSGGGVALMGLYLHLGFFRGAVVAIALHFAWKAVCVAALELSNLHLPLSGMLLLSVSCYGAAFHRRYRWMRRMFGVAQSREIAQALVTEPGVLSLRGQERVLSIMFADIRGFSDFSRQKPPHQVTRLLNTYFSAIVPVIERHGGTINQYVGDGIMVLWGAPRPLPDHARCAVEAAVEMGRVVRDMRQTWQDIGIDMAIGVGIHTGRVVVGAVGSPSRLNYTAIGDAVNAAARIESENKTLRTQVLISVATWQELSTADRARLRCEPEPHAVDLKGVGCMEVYAVAVV